MQIELIVVLVASFTSIIVSIISLVSSLINNKQNKQSEKNIEILKHNLARSAFRDTLIDDHTKENLVALQDIIKSIQNFKDEMQLILSAIETSLDTVSAIDRIRSSRKALFFCYQSNLAILGKYEAKVFHDAKNIVLLVEQIVVFGLKEEGFVSNLKSEDKQNLILLRTNLTDIQQNLRDIRYELLFGIVENV